MTNKIYVETTLNEAIKLLFRDSGAYAHSSASNQFDIGATTLLTITAPTTQIDASTKVDINSNTIDFGTGVDTNITVNFIANTHSGDFYWNENEDKFTFDDDIWLVAGERLSFGSAEYYIVHPAATERLDFYTKTSFNFNAAAIDTDIQFTFTGTTNSGEFFWMEDEDYFLWSDALFMASLAKIYFTDSNQYIHGASSSRMTFNAVTDYYLNIGGTNEIRITANQMTFETGGSDPSINWATNGQLRFQIAGQLSMWVALNQLNFNNGATDTALDYGTSGVLSVEVGGTKYLDITASDSTFNHEVFGDEFSALADNGGGKGADSWVEGSSLGLTGSNAALDKIAGGGETGPANATQKGWKKIYLDARPYWLAIWD